MTNEASSYRQILKSSSIIGGASVINVAIGLLRIKIVATLLGPAGMGLLSLYTGLISTASVVATMGVDTIGTRQIAAAVVGEDDRELAVVRRAIFFGVLLLAIAGALVVWSLREVIAAHVFGGGEHSGVVGWLSIGVALSVASASQSALIQGMRRIGDIARLSVYGSAISTLLGIGLLWQWGSSGLIAFVIAGPLSTYLLGHWYVSRLARAVPVETSITELTRQWQTLLRLGIPFMGAGLIGTVVQLWIRVEIDSTLGGEALGHFQSAWMISMQYIGFVLGAMGADYYPRLTGVINNHKVASNLVNEQTEIALLLSAPVFIAMIGLTPFVIHFLYSDAFMPAAEVLRWQILGDVLKVASWPLGFVIVAAGAGKTFFWSETLVMLLMGSVIAAFDASVGLVITGMAFLLCYVVYLPMVYFLAKKRIQFQWQPKVFRLLCTIFLLCVFTGISSAMYWWGAVLAVVSSLVFGFYSLFRITHMINRGGIVGRIAQIGQKIFSKIGLEHE